MASLARPRVRQLDIVEWCTVNRPAIKALTAERWKMEKGVLDYLKDAASFIKEMRSAKKENAAEAKKAADAVVAAAAEAKDGVVASDKKPADVSSIDQYYMSQDLLKRMKWKRVTWDGDSDYETFSRRIMDSDTLFSKVPAFSHMSIHVVRDKAAREKRVASSGDRQVNAIKPSTLTKWFLEERRYTDESPRPTWTPPPAARQAPFTVDWEAGTVRVLDTASVQEMLVYLTEAAPRVQALQVRMEEEQTKITEDIDNVRFRIGATAIKFNKYEKTFWDDPERLKDPANYVSPADVRLFINSVFKRSFLVRRLLKNNQVRIVPSGQPYAIDFAEKEIRVPANFADYNWLSIHARYESFESFCNFFRSTALAWFFVAMMLVGDFELL
jgi:hypothetical protein